MPTLFRKDATSTAFVLVLALFGAAGCGGDDDDGGDAEGALTAAELEAQSAPICTEFYDDLLAMEPFDEGDPRTVEPFLREAVAILDRAVAELDPLEPAEELREPYEAWLNGLVERRDVLSSMIESAEANDPDVGVELATYLEEDAERTEGLRRAVRQAGLKTCTDAGG
jgi:hypothetical protein